MHACSTKPIVQVAELFRGKTLQQRVIDELSTLEREVSPCIQRGMEPDAGKVQQPAGQGTGHSQLQTEQRLQLTAQEPDSL